MNYPLPCLFPRWPVSPLKPHVPPGRGQVRSLYKMCVCVCLCVSICFSNYTVKGRWRGWGGALWSFISVPQVPVEQVIVTACGWEDVTAYDNHRWPPTKKSVTRDDIDNKTGRASSWYLGGWGDIMTPCSLYSPICLRSEAFIGGGKTFSSKASFANFCY